MTSFGTTGTLPLTLVSGQVMEVHWFADLAVGRPAELHLNFNGLRDVSVTIRWCTEHNGHLSVDVSLGKSTLSLPGVLEETHLNVLCRGTEIKVLEWSLLLKVELTSDMLCRGFSTAACKLSTLLYHFCYDVAQSLTTCKPCNKHQL